MKCKYSQKSVPYPWKLHYDSKLNMSYYINQKDDTITFDLPIEVTHKPKSFRGYWRKIRELKRESEKSEKHDSASDIASQFSTLSSRTYPSIPSLTTATTIDTDDEYLLGNYKSFKNFAGTSLETNVPSYRYSDSQVPVPPSTPVYSSIQSLNSVDSLNSIDSMDEDDYSIDEEESVRSFYNQYTFNDYYDEDVYRGEAEEVDWEKERMEVRVQILSEF